MREHINNLRASPLTERTGSRWTDEEDQDLLRAARGVTDNNMQESTDAAPNTSASSTSAQPTFTQIAESHKRTSGGIKSRLLYLLTDEIQKGSLPSNEAACQVYPSISVQMLADFQEKQRKKDVQMTPKSRQQKNTEKTDENGGMAMQLQCLRSDLTHLSQDVRSSTTYIARETNSIRADLARLTEDVRAMREHLMLHPARDLIRGTSEGECSERA